jgi:hypothetical protein
MRIFHKVVLNPSLILFFTLFAACSTFAVSAFAQEVGSIARVSGAAEVKGRDGKVREAKAKDPVFVADTILTKAGGQVMVRLQDKSSLLVRENSQVVVEAFKFEKKPDDIVSTNVISGAVRAVSGQIAKEKPSNAKFLQTTSFDALIRQLSTPRIPVIR